MNDKHWQQYYRSFKLQGNEKDIAIKEYESANRSLEFEEKLFNISSIFITFIFALLSYLTTTHNQLINTYPLQILIMIILFSCLIVLWIVEKQKSLTYARRKIVFLRGLLGIEYWCHKLILPYDRVEGIAYNPFYIKIFPGWINSLPFTIFATINMLMFFIVLSVSIKNTPTLIFLTTIFGFLLFFMYRVSLFEENENLLLYTAKKISNLIKCRLNPQIEFAIYMAKLGICEAERLKIEFKNLIVLLIFLEDRLFYNHFGIDIKSILRAFFGLLGLKPKSGGSTITQQLVRSLFIKDYNKTLRRKILEIILSIWFESISTKNEILKLYIVAVRFENKCFGVIDAMKYFFGNILLKPTKAEAFFLIERIGNIHSKILSERILIKIKQAIQQNILTNNDSTDLIIIYNKMLKEGKLIGEELK